MQAIQTRYRGPGNVRGSKVIVRAAAGSMHVPWDHRIGVEENHIAAAEAFVRKFKWDEAFGYQGLASGQLADSSYVHVLVHAFSEVRK